MATGFFCSLPHLRSGPATCPGAQPRTPESALMPPGLQADCSRRHLSLTSLAVSLAQVTLATPQTVPVAWPWPGTPTLLVVLKTAREAVESGRRHHLPPPAADTHRGRPLVLWIKLQLGTVPPRVSPTPAWPGVPAFTREQSICESRKCAWPDALPRTFAPAIPFAILHLLLPSAEAPLQ